MINPILIYDGECPFCANYVELLNLRKSFPGLELLDARSNKGHPAVSAIRARGLYLDDGMALIDGEKVHHGAAAIHELARYGDRSGFSALNRAIFRSSARSKLLYPILRGGRNLVVRVLGRGKLGY